jgi:hypothetical protein
MTMAGFIFEIAVVAVVVLGVPAALAARSVIRRNNAARKAHDAATARDARWAAAFGRSVTALADVAGVIETSPAARAAIPDDVRENVFAAYSESSELLRRKKDS